MKLMLISNTAPPRLFGGYEIFMARLLQALPAVGWETHVLSSVPHNGAEPLAWHNKAFSPLSESRLAARETTDYKTTRTTIEATRPDGISVWNLGGLARSVFDAVADSGIPYTIHVGDVWPCTYFEAGDPRFDHVHYCSRFIRSACEQHGLNASDQRVAYLGTDLPAPASCGPRARLLFAGRICEQKGLLTLVRAMERLEGATLTVAGPDEGSDYRRAIDDAIVSLRLADRVRFVGPIPHDQMAPLYAEHGILVYPSAHSEAFGLSLVEAMAHGLLAVTTGVGGTSEIVTDRVNGWLFPPEEPDRLAAVLEEALANPAVTDALAAAGRATVATQFTFDRSVREIIDILEAVRRPAGDD